MDVSVFDTNDSELDLRTESGADTAEKRFFSAFEAWLESDEQCYGPAFDEMLDAWDALKNSVSTYH